MRISGKHAYKSCSCELKLLHVGIWERKEPVEFCPLDSGPVRFVDSSQAYNKEGHCVFDWQCQLNPSHWKYKGIQKAGKATLRDQTAEAATPNRTTPTRGGGNTSVEASQGQEHQKQASVAETTDEREVDITDVAETHASDE